jgi:PhnB protein
MTITPHVNFNGRCAEAFSFYADALGGTINTLLTHGDTPARDHVPAEWHSKIMHASLTAHGTTILGADAPPDRYAPPRGITVALMVPTLADAEHAFKALSSGGTVTMAFQKTFWSAGFGMLTDRFGVPWMVNCDVPA